MLSSAHVWGAAELYGIPRGKPRAETDTPVLSKDERVRPGTWRTAPKGKLPLGPDGNVVLPPNAKVRVLKPVPPKVHKARVRVAHGIEVPVSAFDPKAAERDQMDREAAEQFARLRENGNRLIGGTY